MSNCETDRRAASPRDRAAIAYGDALADAYSAYALCQQAECLNVPGAIADARRVMRLAEKAAGDAFDRLKQEILKESVKIEDDR